MTYNYCFMHFINKTRLTGYLYIQVKYLQKNEHCAALCLFLLPLDIFKSNHGIRQTFEPISMIKTRRNKLFLQK